MKKGYLPATPTTVLLFTFVWSSIVGGAVSQDVVVNGQPAENGGRPSLKFSSIPATIDKAYPTYHVIPKTSFACREQDFNGFYADSEAQCQVFHMCQAGGQMNSFLCPNGTIFNQKYFVCDWWYNVDCDTSTNYYGLNSELYKEPVDNRLDPSVASKKDLDDRSVKPSVRPTKKPVVFRGRSRTTSNGPRVQLITDDVPPVVKLRPATLPPIAPISRNEPDGGGNEFGRRNSLTRQIPSRVGVGKVEIIRPGSPPPRPIVLSRPSSIGRSASVGGDRDQNVRIITAAPRVNKANRNVFGSFRFESDDDPIENEPIVGDSFSSRNDEPDDDLRDLLSIFPGPRRI